MNLSRRNLLKLGLGATAAWAAGLRPLPAWAKTDKIPIGLQLYSLRDDCAKDMVATIQAVGKMGYQGVEFAGYHVYQDKPKELRKLLDDNGLKCCGTHAAIETMRGDAIQKQIEFNQILGNQFLIIPWMGEYSKSLDEVKKAAEMLNGMVERAKPAGMRVGYHAHGGDFVKLGDKTAWELLFSQTVPEVVMQMDIGNAMSAGADPLAFIKQFAGRTATLHVKEFADKPSTPVGEGKVNWKQVFDLCESIGGTQWYIVEQEGYATTPLASVEQCLKNLRKMGK